MRLGLQTAAYDSLDAWWDQQITLPSQRAFLAFGGRAINKYDYRITTVVVSHLPQHLVCICGRALRPRQRYADFLSVRIGTDRPHFEQIHPDGTLHLLIGEDGQLHRIRERTSQSDFMPRWNRLAHAVATTASISLDLQEVADQLMGR